MRDDAGALFRWTNGEILIYVVRDGAGWMVARAWQEGDRLTDFRRWHFTERRPLVGQIRRLVRDATADAAAADAEADRLAAWLDRSEEATS